jgi:acyl-CoA thioesterase I
MFQKLFTLICLSVVSVAALAQSPKAEPATATKTVVVIGDSIADGYGVKKAEAYPEVAAKILSAKGHQIKMINGGISGSVTAEADRRVTWFLKSKPDVIVFELGGNDGLKGTPVPVIERNLAKAIELAQKSGVKVLILGMRLYTNLGPAYSKEFEALFPRLAKKYKVPLVPFVLEDVAMKKDLNQSDMKHPNAKGHAIVAERVAKALEPLL